MNRRRFFAALLAIPFAGKALETLAAAAPPAVQRFVGFEAQRFRSAITVSADAMDCEAFEAFLMRDVSESIRRQIEDSFLNPEEYALMSAIAPRRRKHRSPSNRRRRNAAWRRAHS